MKIKCLIIDDEPFARTLIESYIAKIPSLELIASCEHIFAAVDILQQQEIHLLFSDIHMPEVNGIEFIRSLKNPPHVIFITAYSNYALEGFELDALDYLVKPVPFDRFFKAVNKAVLTINHRPQAPETKAVKSLFVKEGHKLHRILFNEIYYIEGMKDYVKIILKDKAVITHATMKKIEDQLLESNFARIQKSYLVRVDAIKSIVGNMVELYDLKEKLPIGKQYKDDFFDKVGLTNL